MNTPSFKIILFFLLLLKVNSFSQQLIDTLLLKNYQPISIFKIQKTDLLKGKYPIIDLHSHDYAQNEEEILEWILNMDACGIQKTHLLSCNWIGKPFEEFVKKYSSFHDRFAFWTSFDYTGFDDSGWSDRAIQTLIKHHKMGAVGVGEMGDKGDGDLYGYPTPGRGIHLDHPKIQPLLAKCAELKMPINIHIAEPKWMYENINLHNDGLLTAANWAIDTTKVELGYEGLMNSFENAVKNNPKTIFIACHYLNMNHDLNRLSKLLDQYPNLYVDIAGRMGESAVTPKTTRAFLIKHADRVLFGTDNGMSQTMYRNIFRILETDDEHFYIPDYGYHWAYSGMNLPQKVLKKIYYQNAIKIFR
ncbi:MAG: hypothetical protein BGO29_08705 [Bacteroidales bacterium 36-12]|jgi:hypothetical protein|nr:MAG: hypothetical protein BGO29_08705 [Bacteroidales bacterium 36-12]